MDTQVYVLNTRIGRLNAQWQDAHNLRVWTTPPDHTFSVEKGGYFDMPGSPLVVNGVRYGVNATLHRDGCMTQPPYGNHQATWCYSHANGTTALGEWTYGRVRAENEYDRRNMAGEVESGTMYPNIGKGGSAWSGRTATPAARKAIEAAILLAAANLARTAPSGPLAAHIVNLQKQYASLKAQAAALRRDAEVKESEAAATYSELLGLDAAPVEVVAG